MFGSDILDAAIGLFLVYFLFSLLCSAINEWIIAHWSRFRAKMLEQGIRQMLADPKITGGKKTFADEFFAHPLISALSDESGKKPSYIPSHTFVDGLFAVAEEIAIKANPATNKIGTNIQNLTNVVNGIYSTLPETHRVIHSIVGSAVDIPEARKKLEDWFDTSMERIGGAYKRKTQRWMFLWAALFTLLFNVDTLTITRELMNNSKLRSVLVASAEETVKQPVVTNNPTAGSNTVAAIEKKIADLNLPIGWPPLLKTNGLSLCNITDESWLRQGEGSWIMKVFGILVTVCALSFGAPFWFDLLGKLVNLRAAGKKPEAAEKNRKRNEIAA